MDPEYSNTISKQDIIILSLLEKESFGFGALYFNEYRNTYNPDPLMNPVMNLDREFISIKSRAPKIQ